jgi:periplasmic protein TonB
MKNLFLIAFLLISGITFSQENVKVSGNTITTKEVAPIWPGCEKSDLTPDDCFNKQLMQHIKENYKYPRDAKGGLIRGKTTLTFFINEKGGVSDVFATGPKKAINEEAIRIVKLFPKMKPGHRAGKPVSIKYTMPFNF